MDIYKYFLFVVSLFTLLSGPANHCYGQSFLWQTNAKGDDIHIFNIEKRQLVKHLRVGPHPHGLALSPDQQTVYVALEKETSPKGELLAIDSVSYKILRRKEICNQPHEIEITKDGRWIYAPCGNGEYWVINAKNFHIEKKVYTGGRPHNTTVHPNKPLMLLSPMSPIGVAKPVTIIDTRDHQVVNEIAFGSSVRPPAISADGELFFQQVDGVNGFRVANLKNSKVIREVNHPGCLGLYALVPALGWFNWRGFYRCHGLAVRPNSEEIWSTCGRTLNIHKSNAEFDFVKQLELEGNGYWLTFTANGNYAFVALKDINQTAMIDGKTKKVITHFKVGQAPKRNIVVTPAKHSF